VTVLALKIESIIVYYLFPATKIRSRKGKGARL
jgi:hypothetical protein